MVCTAQFATPCLWIALSFDAWLSLGVGNGAGDGWCCLTYSEESTGYQLKIMTKFEYWLPYWVPCCHMIACIMYYLLPAWHIYWFKYISELSMGHEKVQSLLHSMGSLTHGHYHGLDHCIASVTVLCLLSWCKSDRFPICGVLSNVSFIAPLE